MADPELALPKSTIDPQNMSASTGNKIGNNGMPSIPPHFATGSSSEASLTPWDKDKKDDAEEGLSDGEENAMQYMYLTFETELPPPVLTSTTGTGSQTPPDQPDLSKYLSPFLWSESRKRLIIWLSVLATGCTAFTAGSYTPGTEQMQEYFNVGRVAMLVGVTTFTAGFAIAPMVLAPFSEINGRRPVFIASGILFVICQLCCAVTRSFGGMLVARFFTGVGGSTFSTMVGGVVSDIYHTADRNTPMTLFSAGALVGTGLGPFIGAFFAQHTTWRWIFYMQVIMDGVMMGVIIICFKETRGSVLLSRKAKALNKWYEQRESAGYFGVHLPVEGKEGEHQIRRIRWKVKSDEERASLSQMISISCYRPFHLLITEPVVFWFSAWVSFAWAVLYLTFAAIPLIFSTRHNFDIQQQGYIFTSISIASILFAFICIYQEKLARKYNKLPNSPEARLYFACYQSALLPIGMFIFGWTSSSSIPWIAPTIGIALATMGIFSVYLAVFNYLADTYHRYASSALAAQSFCRNMLGGALPLVTTQMYKGLGYGGASSLLGGVGVVLTIVPWVLMVWGPRIRARSRFASDLVE